MDPAPSSTAMVVTNVERDSNENTYATSSHSIHAYDLPDVGLSGFAGAGSAFLQRRPDVLKMLVDQSNSISAHIPRRPFSGNLVVSPLVVAKKALGLMLEEKGVSTFCDADGRRR